MIFSKGSWTLIYIKSSTAMNSARTNEILIRTFNMLVERLTKLEITVDNVATHDQLSTLGRLNRTYLDIEFEIYVHCPLNRSYFGFDQFPEFYVQTDLEWPHDSLCHLILKGVFDADLREYLDDIKRDVSAHVAGDTEDSLIMWDQTTMHLNGMDRRSLREHLIDLLVQKYIPKLDKSPLKAILYDPENTGNVQLSFFVFMKKSPLPSHDLIKVFTRHIKEVTACIDSEHKIDRLVVCPLLELEANTIMSAHDAISKGKSWFKYLLMDELCSLLRQHAFWNRESPLFRTSILQ